MIASSLTFEKKMKRRLRGRAFLLTGMPLIVSLVLPIAAAIVLRMAWIIFLYPLLFVPLGILGSKSYGRDLKARLAADTQASIVVGKDSLLDVLKKVDMMRLDDIDKLKSGRGGRRLAGLLSITERIQNLQGLSSLDSYTTT